MTIRRASAAALGVAAAIFMWYAVTRSPRVTNDYAAYYKFSRCLIEGRFVGALYDSTTLNDPAQSYGITAADVSYNLPTTSLTLLPVAWMDPWQARIAWSVWSIAMYLASLLLLLRICSVRWNSAEGLGMLAFALAWRPAYDNVFLGQLYFLLLFLAVLALRGVQLRRPFLAAIPVACLLAFKGYGVILLVWFVWTRRWREALLACAALVVIIAGTLPWIGVASWQEYYSHVFVTLGRLPSDGHVAYQAINNFIRHFFTYDAEWHAHPIASLSEPAATVLVMAICGLLVAVVIVRNRRSSGAAELSFAEALAVGVVTSPLSFEYHYLLFLPLIFERLAHAEWLLQWRLWRWREFCWIGGVLVLMLPLLPLRQMNAVPPPLGLIAFLKLYAGLAVLLIRPAVRLPGRRVVTA